MRNTALRTVRKLAQARRHILLEGYLQIAGQLDGGINGLPIRDKLQLTHEQFRDRILELVRMGMVHSHDIKPDESRAVFWLTIEGISYAEDALRPWGDVFWDDYKHTIITGFFSLASAMLGGIAGAWLTWLLLSSGSPSVPQ